jgi:cytochrome c-type biogenesis protein
VLPLVPGYVSMVSGLSAAELEAGGEGATPSAALRPVLRGIGLFVAGFTLVFVALGATASGIGSLLHGHRYVLAQVSGVLIIFLGAVLLLGALPARVWASAGSGTLGVVSRLTGEHRFDVRPSRLGVWAAPVMGMAFAFAWTPCIGPVLGVVLGLASRNGTLAGGVVLLFAYSLGLAVPFVIVGLAFGRFTAALSRARHWLWIVEVAAGVILVVFGVLLVTQNVGWVSNHISNVLDDVGLGRLSTS